MNIQIFGKNKCFDTKKAQRYFKERNIKVHISDSIIDDMVVLTRYQEFGARKIDQVLEDKVDDTIIDSILEGKTNIYVNNHS